MEEPKLTRLDMAGHVPEGECLLVLYRGGNMFAVGEGALKTLQEAYALADSLPDGEENMDIMNQLWMPYPKPWDRSKRD